MGILGLPPAHGVAFAPESKDAFRDCLLDSAFDIASVLCKPFCIEWRMLLNDTS